MSDAQPGWYPDPQDARGERWWDGRAWTDQLRPATTPPPPPAWAAPGVAGPPTEQVPTAPQQPEGRKRSRVALVVVGLLVVLALVAGGVALLLDSGGGATVSIDTCTIEADGTLGASGRLEDGDGDTEVRITFRDVDGDARVADDEVTVPGGEGRWEGDGRAGDDVERVTCIATVGDD